MSSESAVPAAPASTILLLRDGPQALEVFMVERHHQIDFAEGALVFPGGKIDPADADPELAGHCETGPGRLAHDLADDDRALRVGAIRETFEESGVLLARPAGESALVGADRLTVLAKQHREAIHRGERTMLELVREESLVLALDRLVPFAHWITPEFMPKRFDTHFYLVDAPTDQLAVHDGSESVDSLWTTAASALELEREGRRTIIFPTLENIRKLARSGSVAEAIERAYAAPIVTVLPRIEKEEDGSLTMVLPEAAGYDTVRAPMEALGGRMPKGAKIRR